MMNSHAESACPVREDSWRSRTRDLRTPYNMQINISEQFYSIQGEGIHVGVPALFMRLQGCNLNCRWCDTTEVWKHGRPWELDEVVTYWKKRGWYAKLKAKEAHLIITGGEPTMQHTAIEGLLNGLPFHPYTELETNGTLMVPGLYGLVSHINCSPKLRNSDVSEKRRLNPEVISYLMEHTEAWFKFVVEGENDIKELKKTFQKPFNIPNNRVLLMLKAMDKEVYHRGQEKIIGLCKDNGYRYSPRLHIGAWGNKRGV